MPVRGPPGGSAPPPRRTDAPGATRGATATDATAAANTNAAPTGSTDADAFDGVGESPVDLPVQDVRQQIPPAHVELVDKRRVDVPSASGLVALGEQRFLVVDDDKGVYLSHPNEGSDRLKSSKKHKELKDLEGIALMPDGGSVIVVEETKGRVFRMDLTDGGDDDVQLGDPVELGRLPKLNKPGRNDGWEGLDVLPGRYSADGMDRLVAVHEGHPRRVGIFSLPDMDDALLLKLPDEAKDHLKDLSDCAVDRKTGRIFLLSDQSASLVELELVSRVTNAPGALLQETELAFVGQTDIPRKKGEKPEGITFDDQGTLCLTMDGK
jgi:hypothetical protein